MAENWPWESSPRAPSSSRQTPPLQSGSSQSSHEAPIVAAELNRPTTRLEETLRTCLANAAPSTPLESASNAAGRDDLLRQPLRSGSGSKSGMKRRSRASRRVPTTVVEATRSDFRETVHRLTGIPVPTPATAPVRPQPQRASYVPLGMPQPVVTRGQPRLPQRLSSHLHITEAPPPMQPGFWSAPIESTFVKTEVPVEIVEPSSPLATTMSQLVSAPTSSVTWWDPVPQPQSQGYALSPSTTGPFDVSGGGPILQDAFEDWFHQDHSASDYMR